MRSTRRRCFKVDMEKICVRRVLWVIWSFACDRKCIHYSADVGWWKTHKTFAILPLCVPELRNTEWHLQTNGYIFDGAAVATGNELRSEVLAAEAIHLSSFCADKELLAFSTERYGGHRLLQLGLSGGKKKRGCGQRTFLFFSICAANL